MRKWVFELDFLLPAFAAYSERESSLAYAVLLREASATALVLWTRPSEARRQVEGPGTAFSERNGESLRKGGRAGSFTQSLMNNECALYELRP